MTRKPEFNKPYDKKAIQPYTIKKAKKSQFFELLYGLLRKNPKIVLIWIVLEAIGLVVSQFFNNNSNIIIRPDLYRTDKKQFDKYFLKF